MSNTFRIKRRVNFADTDLAGVLHFSNYFRLMEEVEHAFWRDAGRSVVVHGEGRCVSWPRVSVKCDYLGPARFEDELDLILRICRIGSKSLELEIVFELNGERIAVGQMTTVCCEMDAGTFRAISIPDDIRAELESAFNLE
jgi:4-hydroxybenzoyl-CoA thioesterase/acyl-CoA thioester hydrolase